MLEKLRMLVSWIVAIGVFIGFMSLVGSPHVVETIIGLVFGAFSGLFTYKKLGGAI